MSIFQPQSNFWSSFTDESKKTLSLAFPMMLGQIGQLLLSVVDTIMIGRVGVHELAGVSFGGMLMLFFLISGMGLCSAVHVLVSQASGSDAKRDTLKVLVHGIWMVLVYSIAIALFFQIYIDVLDYFEQPEEALVHAKPYVIFMAWSILPGLVFRCIRNYSEAWHRPWEPFWVVVFGIVVNIFLNWVFIFGNLGAPAMGAAGAGLATLIARIAGVGLLWWVLARSKHFSCFISYSDFLTVINWPLMKRMLLIGMGTTTQIACEFGFFTMITIMMGWLGMLELAVQQIISNYSALLFMVPLSLAFATTIRIGNAVAEKDSEKLQNIGYGSALLGFGFMSVCALVTVLFRDYIPLIFINDPQVTELAAFLFLFVAISQAFDGLQVVSMGGLRGIPDIRIPLKIVFFSYWMAGIPCAYWLGFNLNLRAMGISIGVIVGLALAGILLLLRFRYVAKARRSIVI